MKPLVTIHPMLPGTPTRIILLLGLLQAQDLGLGKMDRRHEGKLEGGGKCVWLNDGRRVEFEPLAGGGYTVFASKEADPQWPGLRPDIETL